MKANQPQINTSSDWQVFKFDQVVSQVLDFRGKTPLKLGMNWGGSIPSLSANNVKKGYIDFDSECHMASEELYSKWMNKGDLKKGDIVFTMEAPLGNVAIIPDNKKYLLSQRVVAFRFFENISSLLMYQYLLSDIFQGKLDLLGTGSTAKGINQKSLSKIKFSLPPLHEQNRIVSVLETWDKSVEKLTKKIEIKKQIKNGLMQDLLTGKKRLSGFKDKWEFINLGETCKKIKTGKLDANAMVENGKYRFYTCAKDYYFIDDYAFDTEALLVSGNGANVGYVHYYKGKFNAYQRTYVLYDFTQNIIFIKYILDLFLKTRIKEEVREGNTPYITMDTLTDMGIKIPAIKEQKAIAEILTTADEEIVGLEKKLEIIKNQKKFLLNNLITGTIRTPENLKVNL